MKNKTIVSIVIVIVFLLQFSCTKKTVSDLTKTSFIPLPVSVTASGNWYIFSEETSIYTQNELQKTGQYLASELNKINGVKTDLFETENVPAKGIYLTFAETGNNFGDEGYEITIDKKRITISFFLVSILTALTVYFII